MKKFILVMLAALMMTATVFTSCADKKTFKDKNGKEFVAKPYGWANFSTRKIPGVTYQVNLGNTIWSVLSAPGMLIIPAWLTGWQIMEPVSYTPPTDSAAAKK